MATPKTHQALPNNLLGAAIESEVALHLVSDALSSSNEIQVIPTFTLASSSIIATTSN